MGVAWPEHFPGSQKSVNWSPNLSAAVPYRKISNYCAVLGASKGVRTEAQKVNYLMHETILPATNNKSSTAYSYVDCKITPIFLSDGGEEWFDVADRGAKMGCPRTGKFSLAIPNCESTEYVETAQLLKSYRPQGSLFLSNDHAVTYCLASRHKNVTLIVFDSHMDLYSLGKDSGLDKANVMSALDEAGAVGKFIFVGTRASEELIYHQHGRPVREFNAQFARKWRDHGTMPETVADVAVIPADLIESFEDGLERAIKSAGTDGLIGIDVDLDVFSELAGVEYNAGFPEKLKAFVRQRGEYCKKNGLKVHPDRREEALEYADFAANELAEKGIPPYFDSEKITSLLTPIAERLAFFHVTEYQDSLDFDNSTAAFTNMLFKAVPVLPEDNKKDSEDE